jgi:alpha-glucosidase
MLALPGSAYVYPGEELGLPEVIDLPDDVRQDPTWFRTNHERYGRDGCRVPLPWDAEAPAFGFSPTGESWLPQPADWTSVARSAQVGVAGSTLELYRAALRERASLRLGNGVLKWIDTDKDIIGFRNGSIRVFANTGTTPVALPTGTVLLSSGPVDGVLAADTTVWLTD